MADALTDKKSPTLGWDFLVFKTASLYCKVVYFVRVYLRLPNDRNIGCASAFSLHLNVEFDSCSFIEGLKAIAGDS